MGPLKLGHVAFVVENPQKTAEFYSKVMGFRVSDWIDDFFVFMRCNTDHHTVNFIRGGAAKLHHMAFELKDFMHLQNSCDLFGQKKISIIWGPLRHGPGHNIATYHRNPDDQVIELFCELDQMKDEELGYFEPRPWHQDTPQRPKTWVAGKTNIWGPPPGADFNRSESNAGVARSGGAQAVRQSPESRQRSARGSAADGHGYHRHHQRALSHRLDCPPGQPTDVPESRSCGTGPGPRAGFPRGEPSERSPGHEWSAGVDEYLHGIDLLRLEQRRRGNSRKLDVHTWIVFQHGDGGLAGSELLARIPR